MPAMRESSSTGPRPLYLDTCVLSALVKGELSSDDSQAVVQIGQLVQSSDVTVWTSTVMKEELDRIPEPYRGRHLSAYQGIKTVTGHPTTNWIDDDPASPTFNLPTVHPTFAKVESLVPDRDDARHLFQASMNGVEDFVTIDQRTILSRAEPIKQKAGIRVWSPASYVRQLVAHSEGRHERQRS